LAPLLFEEEEYRRPVVLEDWEEKIGAFERTFTPLQRKRDERREELERMKRELSAMKTVKEISKESEKRALERNLARRLIVEEERKKREAEEKKRRALAGLFGPQFPILSDEEQNLVQRTLRRAEHEIVSNHGDIELTVSDVQRLSGYEWLNDEVINFYLSMLKERSTNSTTKCLFYNSFFYTLYQKGYARVRRWSTKANVDIFEMDKVIFPVHLGNHWCTAVINLRDKKFEYYDSMGSPNYKCIQLMRKYLEEEYKDKKKGVFDITGWTEYQPQDIPKQENGYDCGIFACMFADFCSRDAPFTFRQKHMPYLREKIIVEVARARLFG